MKCPSYAFSLLLQHSFITVIIIVLSPVRNVEGELVGFKPCAPRNFGVFQDRIACVCNEAYCDTIGKFVLPSESGSFEAYISSQVDGFFKQVKGKFINSSHDSSDHDVILHVSQAKKFTQKIVGFGGAFTDAAGYNLRKLPKSMQEEIISAYFDKTGIGYSIARIPMGGTDFSLRPYTYADTANDVTLSRFSLQDEDYELKIPFAKDAKLLNPDLLFYASPWTAPPWTKTNGGYSGRGSLRLEYYQLWADYFVKFIKSYQANGIDIWGVTTQNEPKDGWFPFFPFNCMGWSSADMRDWIRDHLGPTFHQNGLAHVKIMVLDDDTTLLPWWPETIFQDSNASQYISGIGLHWYATDKTQYSPIETTVAKFPEKFILATEACEGFLPWMKKVILGSWDRGQHYAENIIRDLDSGVVGWTDWNIALSRTGGPNWAGFGADSPIIVDSDKKEFIKQPMFYALAHIAKFIPRNSRVISVELEFTEQSFSDQIYTVGVERPDGAITLVILNKSASAKTYLISDLRHGRAKIDVPAKSLVSIIYR